MTSNGYSFSQPERVFFQELTAMRARVGQHHRLGQPGRRGPALPGRLPEGAGPAPRPAPDSQGDAGPLAPVAEEGRDISGKFRVVLEQEPVRGVGVDLYAGLRD
jgi:hypothetical protein